MWMGNYVIIYSSQHLKMIRGYRYHLMYIANTYVRYHVAGAPICHIGNPGLKDQQSSNINYNDKFCNIENIQEKNKWTEIFE